MQEHQRNQSVEPTRRNTRKLEENQSSEPAFIAVQHKLPFTSLGSNSSESDVATPTTPPSEKPSNPNPSQQPQYPADPMDPSDPNTLNPIEGAREDLFPKDITKQNKLNE